MKYFIQQSWHGEWMEVTKDFYRGVQANIDGIPESMVTDARIRRFHHGDKRGMITDGYPPINSASVISREGSG